MTNVWNFQGYILDSNKCTGFLHLRKLLEIEQRQKCNHTTHHFKYLNSEIHFMIFNNISSVTSNVKNLIGPHAQEVKPSLTLDLT